MQNFKLNEEFLLNNQDWTFPTFTAYGPGSCLLYTSPSPRDTEVSRMPSSA